jgi:opacity protein-like surface antigen
MLQIKIVKNLLGLQKNLNPYVTGQFGIAIADANATKLNGDIWEDADPAFNNFTYAYKINHVNVAMKGRIISNTSYYGIQPYVSGSIGVGFNRAYDFSITPTISEEIPAPPFSSNTKTALSFTLGAGIQKSLFDNWQVGIGYEFADWGSYSLGRAAGQTVNQGLSLNHVYVQQLQFTVIYIK